MLDNAIGRCTKRRPDHVVECVAKRGRGDEGAQQRPKVQCREAPCRKQKRVALRTVNVRMSHTTYGIVWYLWNSLVNVRMSHTTSEKVEGESRPAISQLMQRMGLEIGAT